MKIWILNHYATNQYVDEAGRHQDLAKYLIERGSDVKIFCASTIHNRETSIATNGLSAEKNGADGVQYIFVKTPPYKGNGIDRILNMTAFWKNVKKVLKQHISKEGKPDVIIASSVHPLTLLAGMSIGKKYSIPCICEVRDLWPESIVTYGQKSSKNLVIRALYVLEKYIYTHAEMLIFTIAGAYEYIKDKGWEKDIPREKVKYLCNGVDLEKYMKNLEAYQIEDSDLENDSFFRIIYAGSIRRSDFFLFKILDTAKNIKKRGINDVKFLIYGEGDQLDDLKKGVEDEKIENVVFKGYVDKKFIPFILSKSDLNILNLENNDILRYGGSQNKLFEYLASGKPVLAGEYNPYSIINENDCGISKNFRSTDEIVDAILEIRNKDHRPEDILKVACKFDFKELSKQLENFCHEIIGKSRHDR